MKFVIDIVASLFAVKGPQRPMYAFEINNQVSAHNRNRYRYW